MLNAQQYTELSNICVRKFKNNGADILHDLILEHDGNYNKIKAFLLTKRYFNTDYYCEEDKQRKEHRNLNTDKFCFRCKATKSPDEFYVFNKKYGKRLGSYCKDCSYEVGSQWYAENKEYVKKINAEKYEKNKERERARWKIYYQQNKEHLKAKQKEYYRQKVAKLKAESE